MAFSPTTNTKSTVLPEDKPINNPEPPNLYKFLAVVVLVLLVLGIGCSIGISALPGVKDPGVTSNLTLKPKKFGLIHTVKNFLFGPKDVLTSVKDDAVNILLLGMGGLGHDGPFLTDTNIIVRFKPSTRQVGMVSVPRDLGVEIPGHDWRKINFANHFGELENPGQGGDSARKVFAKTLGIDIPYYIRIDFKAFEELIDLVNGVKIDVPRSFVDNDYPAEGYATQTIKFTKGLEVMGGQRALQFARSRHGNNNEGSDFARSRRQQLVIMALKDELLSISTYTNPRKVQGILSSLNEHVATNLDLRQIMYLAGVARDINTAPNMLVLDNSPGGFLVESISPYGAYILSPKDNDFGLIKSAIENIFNTSLASSTSTPSYVVAPTVEETPAEVLDLAFPNTKVEVLNGTWRAGLAAKTKTSLTAAGFNVHNIGNSLQRPITTTTIYFINENISPLLRSALIKEMSAPAENVLPNWLQPEYDDSSTIQDETGSKFSLETDVLIILGENAND